MRVLDICIPPRWTALGRAGFGSPLLSASGGEVAQAMAVGAFLVEGRAHRSGMVLLPPAADAEVGGWGPRLGSLGGG